MSLYPYPYSFYGTVGTSRRLEGTEHVSKITPFSASLKRSASADVARALYRYPEQVYRDTDALVLEGDSERKPEGDSEEDSEVEMEKVMKGVFLCSKKLLAKPEGGAIMIHHGKVVYDSADDPDSIYYKPKDPEGSDLTILSEEELKDLCETLD